jgi:hypothetical protein
MNTTEYYMIRKGFIIVMWIAITILEKLGGSLDDDMRATYNDWMDNY